MTNPTELLPCPIGWRLVPVEPTVEMLEAGYDALSDGDGGLCDAGDCWDAMLSAAPLPPENAPPLSSTDVGDNDVERINAWLTGSVHALYVPDDAIRRVTKAFATRAAPAPVASEEVAKLNALQDWLREPDHAERFGNREILDWINRRPTHLVPAILALIGGGE